MQWASSKSSSQIAATSFLFHPRYMFFGYTPQIQGEGWANKHDTQGPNGRHTNKDVPPRIFERKLKTRCRETLGKQHLAMNRILAKRAQIGLNQRHRHSPAATTSKLSPSLCLEGMPPSRLEKWDSKGNPVTSKLDRNGNHPQDPCCLMTSGKSGNHPKRVSACQIQ